MDQLHLLLADAATLEDTSLESMGKLFSLPSKVIKKEYAALESYGLGQLSEGNFSLSQRGAEVLTAWKQMNKTGCLEVATSGKLWLLGPGSFSVPESVHSFESCQELARQNWIGSTEVAVGIVRQRHKHDIDVAKFLDCAPASWRFEKPDSLSNHANALLTTLEIANDNESIERLQRLLIELFDYRNKVSETHDPLENQRKKWLETFKDKAKKQRRENQTLATSYQLCVSLLLGDWLSKTSGELFTRFAAEPEAFVFASSVPVVLEEKKPKPKITQQPRRKKEGFLHSLLRLFTG